MNCFLQRGRPQHEAGRLTPRCWACASGILDMADGNGRPSGKVSIMFTGPCALCPGRQPFRPHPSRVTALAQATLGWFRD